MMWHGLDWLAMGFSLAALYLLGQKNPLGFISFMVANVCWIGIAVFTDSLAILLGNMLFMLFNLRGFLAWKNPRKSSG